jgi:hypothetical protein
MEQSTKIILPMSNLFGFIYLGRTYLDRGQTGHTESASVLHLGARGTTIRRHWRHVGLPASLFQGALLAEICSFLGQ